MNEPQEEDDVVSSGTQAEEDDNVTLTEASPVNDSDDVVGDDDLTAMAAESGENMTDVDDEEDVDFPSDIVDFRGESAKQLSDVMETEENVIGESEIMEKVKIVGSWHNLMFRAITQQSDEEIRIREALAEIIKIDGELPTTRLRDGDGKTRLRTAPLTSPLKPGENKVFKGPEAMAAFSFQKVGRGYRIPLYNSGISIDVVTPTGTDIQTMITNSLIMDKQLGSGSGAHYFAYGDHVNKINIMNFVEPLIVNSSYGEWRKRGKLWQVIKLPDLIALVGTLAALCYPEGFDNFVVKCSRPQSEDHPAGCHHVETFKANIFDMIVSRWAAMSETSIQHMVSTRVGNANHGLDKISQYQAGLNLEGEKISFGDVTFTMRIPSVAEHQAAGSQFIADIVNEIQGDNAAGRYQQFGLRFMRTFAPWIANVRSTAENGSSMETAETEVIVRFLEILSTGKDGASVSEKLMTYINKVQLTYMGFPVTACPVCEYVAETPSGLRTIDPFQAFFTLAFLSTTQTASNLQTD